MRFSGAFGRAMTTATVAASSDSEDEEMTDLEPLIVLASALRRKRLVEVSELIVQSCAK